MEIVRISEPTAKARLSSAHCPLLSEFDSIAIQPSLYI